MQEFRLKADQNGLRADVFIAKQYPKYPRSTLAKLFEQNLVEINAKRAKTGQKLRAGDIIKVDTTPLSINPDTIDLPVIYEDESILVINKPAGILTHSKGSLNNEPTVASFISARISDPELTGNRAGIVHRLDRATSGIIITAKNAKTQSWLQKQFSTRKVKKTYIALVEGQPEPPAAIIDAPIGRNPKKPQTFKVTPDGKPAQTEYKTLKVINNDGEVLTLLELKPTTGRTHQLRVHLSYIGHPIVGDNVYGHAGEHLLLQAKELEVTLPGGHRKLFSVPQSDIFKEFV